MSSYIGVNPYLLQTQDSAAASPTPKRVKEALGSFRRRRHFRGEPAGSQYAAARSTTSNIFNFRDVEGAGKQLLGRITPSALLNRDEPVGPITAAGAANQSPEVPHYNFRFAFVGDKQAGKTSLL